MYALYLLSSRIVSTILNGGWVEYKTKQVHENEPNFI
jgi:hypothetical protein